MYKLVIDREGGWVMAGPKLGDSWDRGGGGDGFGGDTYVIEKPPARIIESSTPSVTFFSNAGNLRLIECFLWLVWLFVVVALAFVARKLFIFARRNVEDGDEGAHRRADDRPMKRQGDEESNEMDSFSNGSVGGEGGASGVDASSLRRPASNSSYKDALGSSTTRVHQYWWTPWILFRSRPDAGLKARIKNIFILLGIVLFYCVICYILTVITIVTFVKMTEGAV